MVEKSAGIDKMSAPERRFWFDHVVVVVPNLLSATREYEKAGFTVTQGDVNGPFVNAIIPFGNDTYIELVQVHSGVTRRVAQLLALVGITGLFRRRSRKTLMRFLPWLSAEVGWVDWCFAHASLDTARLRGIEAGFHMLAVSEASRASLGKQLQWRMLATIDPGLPFLIEDISPRSDRIPSGHRASHPNGARGIAGIKVVVEDARAAAVRLREFLGMGDITGCSVQIQDRTTITFVDAETADVNARALLDRGSEGICSVSVEMSDNDFSGLVALSGYPVGLQPVTPE